MHQTLPIYSRIGFRPRVFLPPLMMLAWLAGVILQLQQQNLGSFGWVWVACFASLACAIWAWILSRRACARTFSGGLMVLAALLAGMAVSEWHAQAHARQILPIDWQSQPLTLDGTVSSVPQYSPDGVRFEFEITKDSIATLMASSVFVPGHLPPRRVLLGWVGD